MRTPVLPPDGGEAFFRAAMADDYGMEEAFFNPEAGPLISGELERQGMLYDRNEQNSTDLFYKSNMPNAEALYRAVNGAISRVTGEKRNHLPLFSVRVFEEAEIGTTVHRNHPSVGPWAIGFTLKGTAPFNVYAQYQLPPYDTIPLRGTDNDPEPLATMDARTGSAWALYTKQRQAPHSSGLVLDGSRRELLLFYDCSWL